MYIIKNVLNDKRIHQSARKKNNIEEKELFEISENSISWEDEA